MLRYILSRFVAKIAYSMFRSMLRGTALLIQKAASFVQAKRRF